MLAPEKSQKQVTQKNPCLRVIKNVQKWEIYWSRLTWIDHDGEPLITVVTLLGIWAYEPGSVYSGMVVLVCCVTIETRGDGDLYCVHLLYVILEARRGGYLHLQYRAYIILVDLSDTENYRKFPLETNFWLYKTSYTRQWGLLQFIPALLTTLLHDCSHRDIILEDIYYYLYIPLIQSTIHSIQSRDCRTEKYASSSDAYKSMQWLTLAFKYWAYFVLYVLLR